MKRPQVAILCCLVSLLPLSIAATNEDVSDRETRTIAGWSVHVSTALLANDPELTAQALKLLQAQLEEIVRVVPSAAVMELQRVQLYISPEYSGFGPKAEYHPDAGWLRSHGRDPGMEKGVEFTNVRMFERETKRMPLFVLHELAHAYHHRVLGYDNEEIEAAYKRVKTSGKYDEVERRDADGNESKDRAYALTNPQEFFAESTEAYFGQNDFFPFNRDELKLHDPETCELLTRLWGVEKADSAAE